MPPNTLAVTILEDGRVRLETGSFAGAKHTSADAYMRALIEELGVVVDERTSLGHVHHHHQHHVKAATGGGKDHS
jgi:hypothetical protein